MYWSPALPMGTTLEGGEGATQGGVRGAKRLGEGIVRTFRIHELADKSF